MCELAQRIEIETGISTSHVSLQREGRVLDMDGTVTLDSGGPSVHVVPRARAGMQGPLMGETVGNSSEVCLLRKWGREGMGMG